MLNIVFYTPKTMLQKRQRFLIVAFFMFLNTSNIVQEHKHKLFDLFRIVLNFGSGYVVCWVALSVMGRY